MKKIHPIVLSNQENFKVFNLDWWIKNNKETFYNVLKTIFNTMFVLDQ